MKGATRIVAGNLRGDDVSIHAPNEGSDVGVYVRRRV